MGVVRLMGDARTRGKIDWRILDVDDLLTIERNVWERGFCIASSRIWHGVRRLIGKVSFECFNYIATTVLYMRFNLPYTTSPAEVRIR